MRIVAPPVSSLIEEPQVLHTIHRPREIYIYPLSQTRKNDGHAGPEQNLCQTVIKSLGPREQFSTFEIMQLATEGARTNWGLNPCGILRVHTTTVHNGGHTCGLRNVRYSDLRPESGKLLLLLLLFIHASVSPIGRVAAGPAGQPGKPP